MFKYFMLRVLYTLIILSGVLLISNDYFLYGYLLITFGTIFMIVSSYFEIKARKKLVKSS